MLHQQQDLSRWEQEVGCNQFCSRGKTLPEEGLQEVRCKLCLGRVTEILWALKTEAVSKVTVAPRVCGMFLSSAQMGLKDTWQGGKNGAEMVSSRLSELGCYVTEF